jgi:hypothetical protein
MRQRKIQLLSLLLALVLTVSLLPAYASATPETLPSWYKAGEDSNEYTISSATQLKEMAQIVNDDTDDFCGSTVYLAASFAVSGAWTPIGTEEHPFHGTFDGQGHTVSGVNITATVDGDSTGCYEGFFGYYSGETGIIENLTVEETINVTASNTSSECACYLGGLSGYMRNGSVRNCGARTTISLTAGSNAGSEIGDATFYIGGLAGRVSNSSIENCYHNGAITFNSAQQQDNVYIGGLAGEMAAEGYNDYRSTIQNCYHTGKISESGYSMVPSIITSCGATAYLQNCYYQENQGTQNTAPTTSGSNISISGNVPFDAAQKVGGTTALVDQLNGNLTNDWRAWVVTSGVNGGYPVLASYWTDMGNYDMSWYDNAAAGTTTYTIRTAAQFAGLMAMGDLYKYEDVDLSDCVMTLGSDLDFSGHFWLPGEGFSGTIDGAGHRITGMTVLTGGDAGLFGYMEHSSRTIRNLGIEDSSVKTTGEDSYAGAFFGGLDDCSENTFLYNCYSTANVSGGSSDSLLIGDFYTENATIDNCYAINGTNTASGEYWSGNNSSPKTADELKGMTGTLNTWVDSHSNPASGTTYYLFHTSSGVNGGFPSFHEYAAPAAGGSTAAAYTILASAGEGGSISPSGSSSVTAGGSRTFTITPADGCEVADVLVDGVSVGAVKSYTFANVTKGHTISVTFKKIAKTVYTDVRDNDWFKDAVDFVTDKGLMNGVGGTLFGPNMTVTRGMLVTILWRLAGSPVVNFAMPFTDAGSGKWYTEAIRWAASQKIVNGVSADKFNPDAPVTREQLAAILYRFAAAMGYDTTQGGMAVREFDDYGDISAYAGEAMGWGVNAGLLAGSANRLMPGAFTTRAQLAVILQRFLTNVAR